MVWGLRFYLVQPQGFYIDLSSQTILKFYSESEDAKINDDFTQNEPTWSLPDLALAYNFGEIGPGKLAVYANAGIPAGGGSLNWKDGTIGTAAYGSTIAATASALVPGTTLTGYDTSLEASSIYYGIGGGVSYSIFDDLVSASAGVRWVKANRSGSIDAKYTYNTIGSVIAKYDYTYEASGFTPIFGIDVRPIKGLTLGARYELETPLEFVYDTDEISVSSASTTLNAGILAKLDQDGDKIQQNLPQVITFGAEYVINPKVAVSAGTNLYLLGMADIEDSNGDDMSRFFGVGYELNLAGQFKPIEKLTLGATTMYSNQGVKDSYFESEANLLTASANPPLDSLTFGLGAKYNVVKTLDVLLSGAYIYYIPADYTTTTSGLEVSYEKRIVNICVGASYKF